MLSERARAIQRVCFDAEPGEADLALLGSRERWLVYRDLVRHRLVGVVEAALPRTKVALGSDAFSRTIDDWLSGGGPRERYFRNVPNELADFGTIVWADSQEAWVADLARYEIACWAVRHAPPNTKASGELTFDQRPLVGSAVRVLRLEHPVHEAPTPARGYRSTRTTLCIHRNGDHRAVSQALNPLAADLLEAWQVGEETVADSVQRVAAKHGVEIGPKFVEKLSALMAGFVENGILLGRR